MKKSLLPIFGILFTLLSSQAHAIKIEWDKCAGYRNEPRAYKECRAYYGYDKPSEENFKTYMCTQAGSMNVYNLDIKIQADTVKIRPSGNSPWRTPSSKVYVEKGGAVIGHQNNVGEFVIEATCAVAK